MKRLIQVRLIHVFVVTKYALCLPKKQNALLDKFKFENK